MGLADCGGCISPGRCHCSHQCPFLKDARSQAGAGGVLQQLSARGAGRGYPTPTPRVCVGLSGGTGWISAEMALPVSLGPRLSSRVRLLLGMGQGAARENPSADGEGGGRRRGDVPSHRLFCKPLQGHGMEVGNGPSCTLTQAPADQGKGWLSFQPSGPFH